MKSTWRTLMLIALAAFPLPAQKIQSETGDRQRIVHLQTALGHLTVIEVNEPVTMVAAGSSSFKVEWKENKVFVQPTEAEVATNLFIWTASERLNYELEPAGAVDKMNFAMDETTRIEQAQPMSPAKPPALSPTDVLLADTPVKAENTKHAKRRVEVQIRDLYESDGMLFIRYAARNQGNHAYRIDTPEVYALDGAQYPQSLYALANTQLGEAESARLKARQKTKIPVLDGHLRTSRIAPGEETMGVVALRLPPSVVPTVLRLQFPSDGEGEIAAYLVR
ncbi:MAG TPA: hypothetical protein VEK33_20210 [Terriglobales bacterium]|nr:hypothetical protein [Terriglobales bacterium]